MEFKWARRIAGLQPSAIREILKVTADPSVISFAAGNPSPEAFPVRELAAVSEGLYSRSSASVLQYGVTEGYTPLIKLVSERLRRGLGAMAENDQVIIVSGGQQGIDLSAKCLLNEGDAVLCENPSFIGALNSLLSYGTELHGVPCDRKGMIPEALEGALVAHPNAKLIYTIPTFQNPSGCVLTAERRARMLELARKYDVLIIEDDPYRELCYGTEPPAPIKSLDTEGRVIYVGSFSKTIAPGIRVAYVCAHRDIIAKLTVAKQTQDVHTNLFFQAACADFLTNYDYNEHLRFCRGLYAAKLDRMCGGLAGAFGDSVKWIRPDGGIFIWCELPEGMDGLEFCRRAGEKKVAAVPGSAFMVGGAAVNAIRLNFSLPSMAQIDEGCARLGETLREMN